MVCSYLLHGCDVIRIFKLCIEERGVSRVLLCSLKIKALLGMLARLPWGRRDMLGSMNGKYEGVSVKYASLIVSCHWIKVFITA